MRIIHPKQQRTGFTLIELTFSISFYTMIVVIALVGFIGILNLYNRAQGLTRTQVQARTAMDALVVDLRNTSTVDFYATGSVSPASGQPLAASARDVYCLSGDGYSRGYASLYLPATQHYHLIRMQSCSSFTNYEMLVGTDVWINVPSGAGASTGLLAGAAAPLRIERLSTNVAAPSIPATWKVHLAVHRGTRVPGVAGFENINDAISAETILESVVSTRK